MTIKPIPNELMKQMQRSLIKYTDIPSETCTEIIDIVVGAIDKFSVSEEPDLEGASHFVKETLDKQYGPVWHCAMGKGFSFDVTSQVNY